MFSAEISLSLSDSALFWTLWVIQYICQHGSNSPKTLTWPIMTLLSKCVLHSIHRAVLPPAILNSFSDGWVYILTIISQVMGLLFLKAFLMGDVQLASLPMPIHIHCFESLKANQASTFLCRLPGSADGSGTEAAQLCLRTQLTSEKSVSARSDHWLPHQIRSSWQCLWDISQPDSTINFHLTKWCP